MPFWGDFFVFRRKIFASFINFTFPWSLLVHFLLLPTILVAMIDACDDNAMDVSEEALNFDDSSFCADEGKIERLLCQMDVCCARYCFKRIKEENGGIDQSVQYIKKCQEAVKRKATKEEKLHYINPGIIHFPFSPPLPLFSTQCFCYLKREHYSTVNCPQHIK